MTKPTTPDVRELVERGRALAKTWPAPTLVELCDALESLSTGSGEAEPDGYILRWNRDDGTWDNWYFYDTKQDANGPNYEQKACWLRHPPKGEEGRLAAFPSTAFEELYEAAKRLCEYGPNEDMREQLRQAGKRFEAARSDKGKGEADGRQHSNWLRQRSAMLSDNKYEPAHTFAEIADWIDARLAEGKPEGGEIGDALISLQGDAEKWAAAERAAFEAWAAEEWPNSNPPVNAWIGWKGRASQPATRPSEASGRGLAKDERLVLEWLAKDDSGAYGECHGAALNGLVEKGFAIIHRDRLGREKEYDRVTATDSGRAALSADAPDVSGIRAEVIEPTDDQIMKALRATVTNALTFKNVTRTVWKDGIDIEEPARWLRDFVRALSTQAEQESKEPGR